MKYLIILFLNVFLTTQVPAAEGGGVPRIDIIEILDSYAKRTGTKFVADPRVKAKVRLIGFGLDEIDKVDLNQIIVMHSFVAYEKDGVVYVLPQAVERFLGDKMESEYGQKWVEK